MNITDVDQFMLAEEHALEAEIEELEAEEDAFGMTEGQYEELNGMFDEFIDEYTINTENLHEEADNKDLVEIMNDDGSMLTAQQLGLSLGLAEEIATENLFRDVDRLIKDCNKMLGRPEYNGDKMTSLLPKKDVNKRKRTKFDKYIDQIIAEDKGKIPT